MGPIEATERNTTRQVEHRAAASESRGLVTCFWITGSGRQAGYRENQTFRCHLTSCRRLSSTRGTGIGAAPRLAGDTYYHRPVATDDTRNLEYLPFFVLRQRPRPRRDKAVDRGKLTGSGAGVGHLPKAAQIIDDVRAHGGDWVEGNLGTNVELPVSQLTNVRSPGEFHRVQSTMLAASRPAAHISYRRWTLPNLSTASGQPGDSSLKEHGAPRLG